jgi:hypothetical protein
VVGRVVISGLSVRRADELWVDLDNGALAGVSLVQLARLYTAQGPVQRILALLNSFAGADLAGLNLSLDGEEVLFLERAASDFEGGRPAEDAADPAGAEPARFLELRGLTARLDRLIDPQALSPAEAALVAALGPAVTGDLEIRERTAEGSALKIDLPGQARLALTLAATGLSSRSVESAASMVVSLPSARLGDGRLELADQGLAARLIPALAAAVAPAAFGDRSPAPPAEPPDSPEAFDAAVLLQAFGAWLSGFEDPDPARAVLNSEVLSLEMGRLLESPQSLAIRWEPLPPGFPQSLIDRVGGLTAILAEAAKGPFDPPVLAAKYKYDIIQGLNLSLEVNNRAPVAVYLPPAAQGAR